MIFRRLATAQEASAVAAQDAADGRIDSRAVGFAVFGRFLISVHPPGCPVALGFIERLATDARLSVDATATRSRLPQGPAELALQLINTMVDSYLELRKDLTRRLEDAQHVLLRPNPKSDTWPLLMHARQQLHWLQELCEEQQDAMQEWLDTLREQPLSDWAADVDQAVRRRDALVARARDVMEHIDRVLHHARRLEQSAETAVQIHFNAQGQRTNDIMRTLTAITAVFLPLNLFTGFRHELRPAAADSQRHRHVGGAGAAGGGGRGYPAAVLAPALSQPRARGRARFLTQQRPDRWPGRGVGHSPARGRRVRQADSPVAGR